MLSGIKPLKWCMVGTGALRTQIRKCVSSPRRPIVFCEKGAATCPHQSSPKGGLLSVFARIAPEIARAGFRKEYPGKRPQTVCVRSISRKSVVSE